MEYTYEIIETVSGEKVVIRSDGATIPMNESNSDYQAYLASLDEQQAALADQVKLTK